MHAWVRPKCFFLQYMYPIFSSFSVLTPTDWKLLPTLTRSTTCRVGFWTNWDIIFSSISIFACSRISAINRVGWENYDTVDSVEFNNIIRFSFYLARCFKRQVPQPLPHIRSQTEVLRSQSNELTAITAILNEPLIKKKMSVKHGAGI